MGLAEKRAIAAAKEEFSTFENEMKAIVGGDITFDLDWDSIAADKECSDLLELRSHQRYLMTPVQDAFTEICADNLGKAAVKDSIKHVKMVPLPEQGAPVTLSQGVLTVPSDIRGASGYGIYSGPALKKEIEALL